MKTLILALALVFAAKGQAATMSTFASLSSTDGTLDMVAKDETVQSLVSTIASQTLSGDPVYCSFDHAKLVNSRGDININRFTVEIPCGPGMDENNHMESLKVTVKGYIEDSMVFTTSVAVPE